MMKEQLCAAAGVVGGGRGICNAYDGCGRSH